MDKNIKNQPATAAQKVAENAKNARAGYEQAKKKAAEELQKALKKHSPSSAALPESPEARKALLAKNPALRASLKRQVMSRKHAEHAKANAALVAENASQVEKLKAAVARAKELKEQETGRH